MLARFDACARASGVDIDFPAAWIAHVREGKVAHLRAYSDRSSAVAAAGLAG